MSASKTASLDRIAPSTPPSFFQRFTLHPAFRDVGLTGIATVLTTVAAMLVISLVGRILGPILLGEYLLVRRMASWFQSLVVLPSGVALPRYVASTVDDSQSTKQNYFVAAAVIGCGIALLLTIGLVLGKDTFSRSLFGSSDLARLILPLGLLLIGLAANQAVFGYYQGALAMGRACSLLVVNLAVIPIAATVLLARTQSISALVDTMGIAMIACSLGFSLPILAATKLPIRAGGFKHHSSELLSYGAARVPADFGLQGLLALPAVIAMHYFPVGSVSYLLLGGSFLSVGAAATVPLGIIILSRVSRTLAEGRASQLQLQIRYFANALIELSVFICLQLIVFTDTILRIWVGPRFTGGVAIVQIAIVAVPFYFVHGGLRGIIDAAAIKAYNTRNVAIAFVGFLIVAAIIVVSVPKAYLLEALAASGVLGMAILGYCTALTVKRLMNVDLQLRRTLPGLSFALLFGLLSFAVHYGFHYRPGGLALLLFEVVLAAAYVLLLRLFRLPWFLFFTRIMFLDSSQEPG